MRLERFPAMVRHSGAEIKRVFRRTYSGGKSLQTPHEDHSGESEIDLVVTADRILATATDRYSITAANGAKLGKQLRVYLSRRSSSTKEKS